VAAVIFLPSFTRIHKRTGVAQRGIPDRTNGRLGDSKHADSPILYVPLPGANAPLGVWPYGLEIWKRSMAVARAVCVLRLLESLAKQVAMALEVERLQETALESQVAVGTERLRSSLLGFSDP